MIKQRELPMSAEAWAEAIAEASTPERCSHCDEWIPGLFSITTALGWGGPPTLTAILLKVRREFGPWAVVGLCAPCGDVAVWPITAEEREELLQELLSWL